jgi:hypothetical protein
MHDELLNETLFLSLAHARVEMAASNQGTEERSHLPSGITGTWSVRSATGQRIRGGLRGRAALSARKVATFSSSAFLQVGVPPTGGNTCVRL